MAFFAIVRPDQARRVNSASETKISWARVDERVESVRSVESSDSTRVYRVDPLSSFRLKIQVAKRALAFGPLPLPLSLPTSLAEPPPSRHHRMLPPPATPVLFSPLLSSLLLPSPLMHFLCCSLCPSPVVSPSLLSFPPHYYALLCSPSLFRSLLFHLTVILTL